MLVIVLLAVIVVCAVVFFEGIVFLFHNGRETRVPSMGPFSLVFTSHWNRSKGTKWLPEDSGYLHVWQTHMLVLSLGKCRFPFQSKQRFAMLKSRARCNLLVNGGLVRPITHWPLIYQNVKESDFKQSSWPAHLNVFLSKVNRKRSLAWKLVIKGFHSLS